MQEKKKIQKEKEVPTMNVNKGRMHKENLQKKLNEKVKMIILCNLPFSNANSFFSRKKRKKLGVLGVRDD